MNGPTNGHGMHGARPVGGRELAALAARIAGMRTDAASLRVVSAELSLVSMALPAGSPRAAGVLAAFTRCCRDTDRLAEACAVMLEDHADALEAIHHSATQSAQAARSGGPGGNGGRS